MTEQRTVDVNDLVDPPRPAVTEAVGRALAEDVLPLGDLTASLIGSEVTSTVAIVARQVEWADLVAIIRPPPRPTVDGQTND